MSAVIGWILFLCLAFVLLFNLFYLYPLKWRDRKLVLGVRNRKELKEAETGKKIDEIVGRTHKQAVIVTILCFVTAAFLLLIKGILLQTFFWMLVTFAAIVADMIPYISGHSEVMNLKRSLGITGGEGINLVDLKVSGNIHALNPVNVILPDVAGFIPVALALLFDLKLIRFTENRLAGSFITTMVMAAFWLMGLLMTLFAFLMDHMKNEVISSDSDVNANYNRARKKNAADLSIGFLWINVIYTVITAAGFFFCYSEMLMLIGLLLYMILLFVDVFVFLYLDRKIEARYMKETQIVTDDDEYWIAGMFYYNPADKRMNVEKRAGVGATVNLAHPAGKVVGFLAIGSIAMAVLTLVWVGLLESTPIRLRVEDSRIICHQLRDEYVIRLDDIASAEYGDDINEHIVIRTAGVGMDTLLKGEFSVDGTNGCRLFLNPQAKEFIKIVTDSGQIYYISGFDAGETAAAMAAIGQRDLK